MTSGEYETFVFFFTSDQECRSRFLGESTAHVTPAPPKRSSGFSPGTYRISAGRFLRIGEQESVPEDPRVTTSAEKDLSGMRMSMRPILVSPKGHLFELDGRPVNAGLSPEEVSLGLEEVRSGQVTEFQAIQDGLE